MEVLAGSKEDAAIAAVADTEAKALRRPGSFLLLGMFGVACLQLLLVFQKSINWDEFHHFSHVYQLRNGTLSLDLQVLHARIALWASYIPTDVVNQIRFARLGMLGFELVAVAALVGLARRFFDRETSLLAGLAYLCGGFVFLHGFSFRPDPIVAATLMSALYLMTARPLGIGVILGCALLIGVSGVVTVKSIFYAPCFAGVAFWQLAGSQNRRNTFLQMLLIVILAIAVFYLTLLWHRSGLPIKDPVQASVGISRSPFFSKGLFPVGVYIVRQALNAPVLTAAILLAPFLWKKALGSWPLVAVMVGLFVPLATLTIYRNTFPYYFVFLLAPVVVSAAPALALFRRRYGLLPVAGALLLTPAWLTLKEPRDVIYRQKDIAAHLHRLYPSPVSYLSWCGFLSDYVRVNNFLTSGIGIKQYHLAGKPFFADSIRAGKVRFVVADHAVLSEALAGRPLPETLMPEDVVALQANFIHHAGPIWLLGKRICPGETTIDIAVPGHYVLQGAANLIIDGQSLHEGQPVFLDRGSHRVAPLAGACVVLWAGRTIPARPSVSLDGAVYAPF